MDDKTNILFVDREQGEYLLLADMLAQLTDVAYHITWQSKLEGVLHNILSGHYDLVILDYYWGERNVHELLNTARVQACTTPILVMTDTMDQEVDRNAIKAGAADYLIKSEITPQLLERSLRYALERKQSELHLSRLAHYDPLTDIPNRILFRDRLEHAIQLADRDKSGFTLLFVDLNGFKQINDSFGHDVGDAVIRMCAERLTRCMRRSDTVGRMGGDEFTLLLESMSNSTDVAHLAEKIIDELSAPMHVTGYEVVVGCSIGIAVYPEAGRSAGDLLKSADMAMYQAKQEDNNSFRFFTESMNREARRQLRLESDLRIALKRKQLFLHYQPRLDIRSNRIVAVEALLRWQHPDKGVINAADFIGVAQDTGIITEIGYWVIEQACLDLAILQPIVKNSLAMAINLSVRQFLDDDLVPRIARIFSDTGVNPADIEFELTEATFMENIDLVSLCMRPLSFFGVAFSLDDFGTGSSSFSQLQKLPIAAVKIDSRFMAKLESNHSDRRLVSAMINLAQNLGKVVVAEGVETEKQLEWLTANGCDQMQGYSICPPQDLKQIRRFLKNRQKRTSS